MKNPGTEQVLGPGLEGTGLREEECWYDDDGDGGRLKKNKS